MIFNIEKAKFRSDSQQSKSTQKLSVSVESSPRPINKSSFSDDNEDNNIGHARSSSQIDFRNKTYNKLSIFENARPSTANKPVNIKLPSVNKRWDFIREQ